MNNVICRLGCKPALSHLRRLAQFARSRHRRGGGYPQVLRHPLAKTVALLLVIVVSIPLWVASDSPEPSGLKVLTWNIRVGSDEGLNKNGWPKRKHLYKTVLEEEEPALFCVQEALDEQLEFLESLLLTHSRVGVGRDDGKSEGEHCAIFYDKRRLKLLDSGNFWLSDTPEKPSRSWNHLFKRVVTWAKLEDLQAGRTFWVFNTHFPITGGARKKSARLILERIKATCSGGPVLLVGDFNCGPAKASWKAIVAAGFTPSEKLEGKARMTKTYHSLGKPLTCIDAIFTSKEWAAKEHKVIKTHSGHTYPSDHFGVCAIVTLKDKQETKPRAAPQRK